MSEFIDTGHPNPLEPCLAARLESLKQGGLYREIRQIDSPQGPHINLQGRSLINFSSNDYLGLANEATLKEAALAAIRDFGTGSGASRLISGSLGPHVRLEETLAAFKGTEASLTFSSGYAAAMGTLCAVAGKGDIVLLDKLSHACLIDAVRLAGAKYRVFAHNDLNQLEKQLKWASRQQCHSRSSNILIVTESLFSMDGDAAPLTEMLELKDRYGAWIMVDEAHATGLYGAHRRGLAEEMGVSDRIEVQMGTLGKALGAAGGYICGSRTLIDYLTNQARSFIFSTAPVPAASAAASAAIKFIQGKKGEERCVRLWQRALEVPAEYRSRPSGKGPNVRSAIIPIHIGEEAEVMHVAATLRDAGLFVPAIRYPTVARGKARLRISLNAAHTSEDISTLSNALNEIHPAGRRQRALHQESPVTA